MVRYWLSNCPSCHQGRLFAVLRHDTGALCLECEECYGVWASPDHVSNDQCAGLMDFDVDEDYATREEITSAGWDFASFTPYDDRIGDVGRVYRFVRQLSAVCRLKGRADLVEPFDAALHLGSSGLEILGAIATAIEANRPALTAILPRHMAGQLDEAVAFARQCFGLPGDSTPDQSSERNRGR
jgi:hypothetical protein